MRWWKDSDPDSRALAKSVMVISIIILVLLAAKWLFQ
jgi:hypothetical protein